MVFYGVIILGLVLSLFKNKKAIPIIYAVIIAGVASFRYGCGADYFTYQRIYNNLSSSILGEIANPSGRYELCFRLLGTVIKKLNIPYQGFLAILAIIIIYFVYKVAIKYTKNPTLALTIYFAFYYVFWIVSALRQGFAIAIGMYFLLEAVTEKKVWQFIVATLVLTLFHYSALFLLALYFVSKIEFNKKRLIILLVSCVIIGILPWGGLVHKIAEHIEFLKKVTLYVGRKFRIATIWDFQALGRIFFIIIAIVFYDKYSDESPKYKKIIELYVIGFAFYFLLQFSENIAARLAIYAKVLDIVILTNILYLFKTKRSKIIYASFLGCLLLAYLFKDLRTIETLTGLVDSNPFMTPYVNIFNKVDFTFIK